MKWGHPWEFKKVIPPPAREKKNIKKKDKSAQPTKHIELKHIWDSATVLSQDEFEKTSTNQCKSEQDKRNIETTICFLDFPDPLYSDEDRFQIFCLRNQKDHKKQFINRIKWMKNDTKPEELKWMLNGGRSLRPGEFHRAEVLMYEQYLQIHKILGCPPVGSTIIDSESLIDIKIRQTMDKAIRSYRFSTLARSKNKRKRRYSSEYT